jgi:hypothetical protein
MKIKRKEFDIFNISFLDVISCGFGAVVLLVLISNTAEDSSKSTINTVENLLRQVLSLERSVESLTEEIELQQKKNEALQAQRGSLGRSAEEISQNLSTIENQEKSLASDLQGLSQVQDTLERISITPSTAVSRDEEVGGIPVDSDYVVFIVDTSGSMQANWGRVSREIINVLKIHPKVNGFQILNDQGKAIISGYSGRFIPDTPQRRKSVMNVFAKWQDASNSSPVEGITTALKLYAKPGQSTAIYVFGDDYTGSSYDTVITEITTLNRLQKNGRRLAKIHGVGFLSQYTTNRFAILMRELTLRNGGTFIALPL